ncbi:MAG TPA: hypothetical protein VFF88_01235, partial [Methylocella sp.]|nr:hypothetical protein [Methylocella sp.]
RVRGARKTHAEAGPLSLGAIADEEGEKHGAALLAAAPAGAQPVPGNKAALEPLPEQAGAEASGAAHEAAASAEQAAAALTAGEPERPKRSGWWQRARAGWRS